jgi:phage terminase large subunit-like protein
MFLAGVGAGKTLTGVHEAIALASQNPTSDGCITSPTFPMLRDVIIPLWETWVPQQLYAHKKADQCFIWRPTGRKIFLRSADRPGRISGLNLAWAWLDEAALLLKKDVWNILRARIRDPNASRRCLYCTTTPLGLNWLIGEFRRGCGSVIRARTADNKRLPDDFEPGLRARFGPEYAAQYLDAIVLELQGMAWPIMHNIHCAWDLGERRRRFTGYFGGVDWGHTQPAALVVGATDFDGRWHLVDCWYKRGKLREEIAAAAGKLQKKWGVTRWWADHDPEGVLHMQREGCDVQLAEKAIIPGVQCVRSLTAVRADGEPRLYVLASLDDWHREVEGYSFPEDEEEPKGENGDHAMDATRYMIFSHAQTYTGGVDYATVSRGRMGGDVRSLH